MTLSGLLHPTDVVCLSHLRWNFVFQRPQHLMSRFARGGRVFFVEEPVLAAGAPSLRVEVTPSGVRVVTPVLPRITGSRSVALQRALLRQMLDAEQVTDFVLWLYTPMALPLARSTRPAVVVYDCMDELSAFAGAPADMKRRERELLQTADLVFTGGHTLYEAKRRLHPNVHAFPSSVEVEHFARARRLPPDASCDAMPRPRLGYFGVIDERMDLGLIGEVARVRPQWHILLVGPVAKIDPATLPRAPNIHYLGPKSYEDLPACIAGWDVALIPFARNDATRFISPTKTPEYLAAGKPVVSTSIRDVVRPYGESGLVRIADSPADFVAAVERVLDDGGPSLTAVDEVLAGMSWDLTWNRMCQLVDGVLTARKAPVRPAPVHPEMPADQSACPPVSII